MNSKSLKVVNRLLKERLMPDVPLAQQKLGGKSARNPLRSFRNVSGRDKGVKLGEKTEVIINPYKKETENQLESAPTNVMGFSSSTHGAGAIDKYDPALGMEKRKRKRRRHLTVPEGQSEPLTTQQITTTRKQKRKSNGFAHFPVGK